MDEPACHILQKEANGMEQSNEISHFMSRFSEEVLEIVAVTGASGIGAGRANGNSLWHASIPLIAWMDVTNPEVIHQEELRLEWLVDDEGWKAAKELLSSNSLVHLLVQQGEHSFMLVHVVNSSYDHPKLEQIRLDAMKPIHYEDEVFGSFVLDQRVKFFEKEIIWANQAGMLYFDWDEDEQQMRSALQTAYVLFSDQERWNEQIRAYAAEQLVELANDWLQDNDEPQYAEITPGLFVKLMELDSISVYPNGDFELFFRDGDMFWGHSIIVDGNINGSLNSAEIAG